MRYGAAMNRRVLGLARAWAVVLLALVFGAAGTACRSDGGGNDGAGEGEGDGGGAEGEGEGEGEGDGSPLLLAEVACTGDDWAEVVNVGTNPVSLGDWAVTDDPRQATRRVPFAGTLAPGERAVVAVEAFGIACDEAITLLQGDEVRDATTLAVARAGATWSRLPEPVSRASAFSESLPTPAAPNQPFSPGDLRLNEIDCRGRDRVELVNAGPSPVDVAGFQLLGNAVDATLRYVLPAQTVGPGERLVIVEHDPAASPPVDGFPFDVGCTGSLTLLDAHGATVDAAVLQRTAEAFTWGRLPDGRGDFTATEETIGAPNAPAALLATDVFDDAIVHSVVIDVPVDAQALLLSPSSPPLDARFGFDGEPTVPCVVRHDRAGRYVLGFADVARFRGLEALVVEFADDDPSALRTAVAGRAFAAATVIAPRVGFAAAAVAGRPARLATLIEILDGRRLRRELSSTVHVYDSGVGPRDVVDADVDNWSVVVGDVAVRDDLRAVAAVVETHRTAAGFLAAAGPVLALGATLRFLAVDAWLDHADGYARARGDVLVHVDAAGEARLLPGDLDGVLRADGPLFSGGSAVVDACLADPDCVDLYGTTLEDVDTALVGADLVAVIDRVASGLRPHVDDPGRFDAAVLALRERVAARPAEVRARRAADRP
jgi:hypothetical protein